MQRKIEAGGWAGCAPPGYRNVTIDFEGRQVRTIAVDEQRGPLIRQAWLDFASGDYSLTQITNELENRGLTTVPRGGHKEKPLSRSQVARMFHHPFYYGMLRWKGDLYPGRHEPLTDKDTFDRVQAVLTAHAVGEKQFKHVQYLKSAVWCGYCGQRMAYSMNKGRGGVYHY